MNVVGIGSPMSGAKRRKGVRNCYGDGISIIVTDTFRLPIDYFGRPMEILAVDAIVTLAVDAAASKLCTRIVKCPAGRLKD